jgi:hypothetical protein
MGVEFKVAQRGAPGRFKNAVVMWLVCPEHGIQVPYDVENVRPLQRTSKKGKTYDVMVVTSHGEKVWAYHLYDEVERKGK